MIRIVQRALSLYRYYYFIFLSIRSERYNNILCTFSYTRDILFRETNHVDAGKTLFMDSPRKPPPYFIPEYIRCKLTEKKMRISPVSCIFPVRKCLRNRRHEIRSPTLWVRPLPPIALLLMRPRVGAVRRMCKDAVFGGGGGRGKIDCALRTEIYSSE